MPEAIEYPWFSKIDSNKSLEQGDILLDCPVFVPSDPNTLQDTDIPGKIIDYDVIIMSQSCDLDAGKIETVILCPVFTLDVFSTSNPKFQNKKEKNNIIKGLYTGLHILNKCEYGKFNENHLIVDIKNIFGVNIHFLNDFKIKADFRIRLLPPYREHLAQSFARFFMRIGLPTNIEFFN